MRIQMRHERGEILLLAVELVAVEFDEVVVDGHGEPDILRPEHHLGGLQRVVAEPVLPEDAVVVVAKRLVAVHAVEI